MFWHYHNTYFTLHIAEECYTKRSSTKKNTDKVTGKKVAKLCFVLVTDPDKCEITWPIGQEDGFYDAYL